LRLADKEITEEASLSIQN